MKNLIDDLNLDLAAVSNWARLNQLANIGFNINMDNVIVIFSESVNDLGPDEC